MVLVPDSRVNFRLHYSDAGHWAGVRRDKGMHSAVVLIEKGGVTSPSWPSTFQFFPTSMPGGPCDSCNLANSLSEG